MKFSQKLFWSILDIKILTDWKIDEQIIKNCFLEAENFENKYSRFIKNNFLYNLNKTKSSQLNWELLAMVNLSNKLSEITNWYFDITILPFLENNWYGIEENKLELNYGYKNIEIQNDIINLKKWVSIDLWAVWKWYIIDKMYNILDKYYDQFIINFGWDIRVKWKHKVFLEDPLNYWKSIWEIYIENESISSSTPFKRKIKKWHHLINPIDNNSQNDKLCIFIKHKLASFSDIFSTALFVTPLDKSIDILSKTKWLEWIIISKEGKIIKTKWFKCKLNIKW